MQPIETILNKVIDLYLIPKYNQLGMRATGEWAESLQAENNVIKGRQYTNQLVNGRKGGSMPPIRDLENWVKAKFGYSGAQATQTAWAVAKKIEKSGTTWHQRGGSDLLEILESTEVLEYINSELGKYYLAEVQLEITRQLQSIAI